MFCKRMRKRGDGNKEDEHSLCAGMSKECWLADLQREVSRMADKRLAAYHVG